MGIFTRFRDIVSANINSILDKAEDPEKMVRLMIQEMEDTLVEVKANCAGVMAGQKKLERELVAAGRERDDWEAKAQLAVNKGRDDLARAAIAEKRRYQAQVGNIEAELVRTRETVAQFQEDIAQLEAKLADARERQRTIIHRRSVATTRREAQGRIRQLDTTDAFAKFEAYEQNIDRLEAEGELVNSLRPKKQSLREELAELEHEDEIEQELARIKAKNAKSAPAQNEGETQA